MNAIAKQDEKAVLFLVVGVEQRRHGLRCPSRAPGVPLAPSRGKLRPACVQVARP